MSSTAGAARQSEVANDRELIVALWLVLLALACVLAVFLTWRRLAGALVQPPSGWVLVTAAFALASFVALSRWAIARCEGTPASSQYLAFSTRLAHTLSLPPSNNISHCVFAAPGVVAIALLAALTLPGTPALGIAAAWFVLIGQESAGWLLRRQTFRRAVSQASDELEIPAGLVQQLTRVREADRESIHALVSAEYAPLDSLAIVHIAFCPPLASRPTLTAHAVDADVTDVRITQAETFGVRIEIRRPHVTPQPQSVVIEVLGWATARESA
jgi:hypothetical protein